MRRFANPIAIAAVATVGLGIALVAQSGAAELALDVYLLFLGGLALAVLLRETGKLAPPLGRSDLEIALRRRPVPEQRPPELVRLERGVELACQTSFDAYYRLRPVLREIAQSRLARRGVDLDASSGSAESLLGEETWKLVRPDLPRPRHHLAAGVPLEQIEHAIASLEQLA